jgi:hypothetical protein
MAPQPEHIKRDAAAAKPSGIRDESYRDAISTVDKHGQADLGLSEEAASGKFTNWRQWFGYAFLTLLFVGPFIRIGGEPLLMINWWSGASCSSVRSSGHRTS